MKVKCSESQGEYNISPKDLKCGEIGIEANEDVWSVVKNYENVECYLIFVKDDGAFIVWPRDVGDHYVLKRITDPFTFTVTP